MNSPRVRQIAALVLAFALGMLAGGSGARQRRWHRGGPETRQHHLLQLFSRKLDLTAQQQTEIGGILEQSHQRMRSLHEQVRPQFEAMRAETTQQIRAVLTPEQAAKFDAMEEKFAKHWSKRRERWRSGYPGGRPASDAPPSNTDTR
jgi:Spy/CpxP family protein refolding chaperone